MRPNRAISIGASSGSWSKNGMERNYVKHTSLSHKSSHKDGCFSRLSAGTLDRLDRPKTVMPLMSTRTRNTQYRSGTYAGVATLRMTQAALSRNDHKSSVRSEEVTKFERTSLPPAHQRQSLVANSKYTVYNTTGHGKLSVAGEPRYGVNRSLPNSRTQDITSDIRRHNSAPYQNQRQSNIISPRATLPRINNLVNGKNASPGMPNADGSRNLIKYSHGRKRRKAKKKETSGEGAAGVSTREHDVQTLVSPKFASSWAKARVDQVTRGNVKSDEKEENLSPRSETQEGNISRVRSTSKNYPKPWTINAKPASKDNSLMDDSMNQSNISSQHAKSNPRQAGEPKRSKSVSQTYQLQNKSIGKLDSSLDEIPENSEVPKKVSVSYARRDRLRMQRAKSRMLEKIRLETESQADLDEKKRRYSNIDAANVYFANVAANVPPVHQKQSKVPGKNMSTAETDASDMDNTIGANTTTDSDGLKGKSKEYVLNQREAAMYLKFRSVYDEDTGKYKSVRQQRFFKKVEEVQLEKWKIEHEEYKKKKQRARESKERQIRQLKHVREKFEQEQARRFRNQFVTGKILEHEWQTRHLYGLPDEINGEPQYAAKLKAKTKKPVAKFDRRQKFQTNKKKYKKLFQVNTGPRWDSRCKTPKMEGIDTIVLEETDGEGQTQGRKIDVKDIVNEALQALDDDDKSQTQAGRTEGSNGKTVSNTGQSDSKKSSNKGNFGAKKTNDFLSLKPTDADYKFDVDSLDLSDTDDPSEDIFEKARRKYNIELDSDDDL